MTSWSNRQALANDGRFDHVETSFISAMVSRDFRLRK
jgi:hypothetical protein